jgi:hypothetical protein
MGLNVTIGFFDHPDQTEPTYDPPHDGPCIVCGNQLSIPVMTISLMRADNPLARSYFYRAHKICYEADPEKADALALDLIERPHPRSFETAM